MQIIIDISEDYQVILTKIMLACYGCRITELPQGHGRLFDERDIVNGNYEIIGNRIYELEPILETDRGEEE